MKVITVVAAAIFQEGRVLVARRGPLVSGAGAWEFPGGKVEAGESESQALEREILEELGLHIKVLEFLSENLHQYPAKKIHLRLYGAEIKSGEIKLTDHDQYLWLEPRHLHQVALADADLPFVQVLQSRK